MWGCVRTWPGKNVNFTANYAKFPSISFNMAGFPSISYIFLYIYIYIYMVMCRMVGRICVTNTDTDDLSSFLLKTTISQKL